MNERAGALGLFHVDEWRETRARTEGRHRDRAVVPHVRRAA
jgi:hypothetical protein